MERDEMIPHSPGAKVGYVIDPVSGCWQWRGAIAPNGYGRVGVPGQRRTTSAHRLIYERQRGPVPRGLDLDHLCRNRGCVNPAHLEPVTRSVNSWRGKGCKLNPEKVREIRERYASGGVTQPQLAAEYSIDNSVVSDIVARRTWQAVA